MNTNIEQQKQTELGYEAYAKFSSGTYEQWVERIQSANVAAGIQNYDRVRAKQTMDRLIAQYERAWKAKAAIGKHEKFARKGNGVKGTKYSLSREKIAKAEYDSDHFFIMRLKERDHSGRIIYAARGRVKKQFHFTGDNYEPEPGSMRDLFGYLIDESDSGRFYFFKSEMPAQIERVLREHGHLDDINDEEVKKKVESVWNVGRKGKFKGGYFENTKMSVGTVWYGSAWHEPTEKDVEGMCKPVPMTEMQQRSRDRFRGRPWLQRDKHIASEDDPVVRFLVDNVRVYEGGGKTAEQWAVEAIAFAHDTDNPRKRAIYYDNDPKSPTYKHQCYAGWYDPDKWRKLKRCVTIPTELADYKRRR